MLVKWCVRFVAKAVLFGLAAHIHTVQIADAKYLRKQKNINFGNLHMKCKKCKYYYRTMASEQGYNPYPYCHYYEETQKRPNILTQECFHKKAANNRPHINQI